MLISVDHQRSAERCREVGINAYLLKPLKQSELLNTILDLLSRPEMHETGVSRLRPAAPSQEAEPAVPGRRQERPLRILLAEDNLVNQRLAVRILEKQGHTVVVANNGKEALAILAQQPFDLVLMDLEMPELGGFATTARVREQEKETGGHLPIIALTAHALKGDRERCLAAGMDGYVAKPIHSGELFEAIHALFPATPAEPAPAPEPARPPVVDLGAALERVGGDRQLLRELAAMFQVEAPRLLAEVQAALAARDVVRLKRAGHTLKGAVGTFGARRAIDAALAVEQMGAKGNLEGAEAACRELEEAVAQLQRTLAVFGDEEAP
jgi:CheY-like chemotaxis protein